MKGRQAVMMDCNRQITGVRDELSYHDGKWQWWIAIKTQWTTVVDCDKVVADGDGGLR